MRYSRFRKQRSQQRYMIVLTIGLLLFGVIYFFSAGFAGKSISEILVPILGSGNKQEEEALEDLKEQPELILPQNQDENQENIREKVVENLRIDPSKLYAIQIGAFNSRENAEIASRELQGMGGAGYIIEDNYFRVLAVGFPQEGDAQKVVDQLKTDGIESRIYEISIPGVNMEITASPEKVEGIKSSFSLWQEKTEQTRKTFEELDNQRITLETALVNIRGIRDELAQQLDMIKNYTATQESNGILTGIQEIYKAALSNIDDIVNGGINHRVAFSSRLKYNNMYMVFLFKDYMEQITKHRGNNSFENQ